MAGTNSTFHATAFRAAIQSAMTMGIAPTGADAITFCWNPTTTTVAVIDGEGVPFDPGAAITTHTAPAPVSVPCAVQYVDATGDPTPFGSVVAGRVKVTLLDVNYTTVGTADYVLISGNRFLRHHEEPPVGLFNVEIHTIIYIAENEK